MRRERRSTKTIKMDFVRNAGEMADHEPSENAKKFFDHKPYECDREDGKKEE